MGSVDLVRRLCSAGKHTINLRPISSMMLLPSRYGKQSRKIWLVIKTLSEANVSANWALACVTFAWENVSCVISIHSARYRIIATAKIPQSYPFLWLGQSLYCTSRTTSVSDCRMDAYFFSCRTNALKNSWCFLLLTPQYLIDVYAFCTFQRVVKPNGDKEFGIPNIKLKACNKELAEHIGWIYDWYDESLR